MPLGLVGFDKRSLGDAGSLVGIDEVGRGCLAGPVVAAAIRCEAAFYSTSWCRRHSRNVDDSKRLTADRRMAVIGRFSHACRENWIQIGIGVATVGEIERHNIYHATTLAMKRALAKVLAAGAGELWAAVEELGTPAPADVRILIDGRPIRHFPLAHEGVVKGDQRSLAIALAGIHAKEWRDAHMRELHAQHPEYGFVSNKGYGTAGHLEALLRHGPSLHHRPSFLHKLMARGGMSPKASQGSLFDEDSLESQS